MKEAQVDQRLLPSRLIQKEASKRSARKREQADDEWRAPTGARPFDHCIRQGSKAGKNQNLSHWIISSSSGCFGLWYESGSERDRRQANGQVDPEDRAPADGLRQRAAKQRAKRQRHSGHGAPNADRA